MLAKDTVCILTSKVSFKEFGIEVGEPLVIQQPCNRLQMIFYQAFTYRNMYNKFIEIMNDQ